MYKLFQKKPAEEVRTIRYPLLLTQAEAKTIRHSAEIKNMSVAEFIRSAALRRKTDVDYETRIVLQLSDVVRLIRDIHKGMVETQIEPPKEIWPLLMDEAMDAMKRISK